jgi:23S rRNA pseudouridine2605 synthase
MPAERIQKLLARSGLTSRRGAEVLIAAGRVTVNGKPAHLGDSADLGVDRLAVDGAPLPEASQVVHYAVHKPVGLLSSAHDERGRRSVVSLIDARDNARLWPAGRLDVDSEGLMVLTNDGDWANRVLHPRYGVEREYAVLVDPTPTRDDLEALLAGVELDDGPARLLAIQLALPPPEVDRSPEERGRWLRLRVGEGRKHEVRRLFARAATTSSGWSERAWGRSRSMACGRGSGEPCGRLKWRPWQALVRRSARPADGSR